MNEATITANGMYDEVAEIRNLNNVEGFDPRKYMRIIQKEGQIGKYYLDVVYRKLWFRLKYPEGKIVKKILKLTDQMAIVEAKVYLSRNDTEDSFISNAMAQKYLTSDDQFGNKFVELAETAAVGRALADAGFGLQFADKEGEFDPEVTDAPIDPNLLQGNMPFPDGTYMEEELLGDMGGASEGLPDHNIPGQYGMESYIPMPQNVMQLPQQTAMNLQPAQSGNMQTMQPVMTKEQLTGQVLQSSQVMGQPQQTVQQKRTNAKSGQQANTAIDKKLPVEQIYAMLNRDIAASVIIPMGYNKGKTLGQVALEKPDSLKWYITEYGGPDNLLRAAAKFLLDAALGQAS